VPLAALKLTSNVPAAAGVENVTGCGMPGWRLNGEAGETVIPRGKPLTVTVAEPAKPFSGRRERVIAGVVLPTSAAVDGEETDRLKSGAGGGDEEAPHPWRRFKLETKIESDRVFFTASPWAGTGVRSDDSSVLDSLPAIQVGEYRATKTIRTASGQKYCARRKVSLVEKRGNEA
jgi:hypothetical protein